PRRREQRSRRSRRRGEGRTTPWPRNATAAPVTRTHPDAWIRCGRERRLVARTRVILDDTPDRLGPLTEAAAAALGELADANAISRTWARDHTLWRDDPTEISDRLGWLSVAPEMSSRLDDTTAVCVALAAEV